MIFKNFFKDTNSKRDSKENVDPIADLKPDSKENLGSTVDSKIESKKELPPYEKTGFLRDIGTRRKLKKNYGELSREVAENITPQEEEVIKDYTGDGYKNMNKILYASERCYFNAMERKQLQKKIDTMTALIDKRTLEQQGIFYRGMDSATAIFGQDIFKLDLKALREKYVGEEFVSKSFWSMSFSKGIAKRFSEGYGGIVIEAKIPKGANALCVGKVGILGGAEGEVILQRGMTFKIDSIDFRNKKFYVKMTAIKVSKNDQNGNT